MNGILLTQNDGIILGPVSKVLGWIMEVIFNAIDGIGIPNIGLAIILFTIVVNLLMLPLTIKQQKFSKLSAKMNPEIQAIQAKYKNRKDNDAAVMMQQETQAVYAKYGVSPTGSCLYLLIQMPILLALYRVIYAIPAYVTKVGDVFRVLADKIISVDNGSFIQNSGIDSISKVVTQYGKSLTSAEGNVQSIQNGVVDILNRLSTADMAIVAEHYDLSQLTYEGNLILSNAGNGVTGLIDTYNNFLGLNVGNSPWYTIKEAWANGAWLILIGALAIPVLSAVTQWINTKLMPQANTNSSEGNDTMAAMNQSMKFMPLLSAWFCFSLPAGMGLYWVAGSVVRSIQQVVINKHIDKLDFDEIIKKNSVKSAKKLEKMKEQQEKLNTYAAVNTKSIQKKANISNASQNGNTEADSNAAGYYKADAKPGSMMAKANMVREFNERNNKQSK